MSDRIASDGVDPLVVAVDLESQVALPNAWDGHGRADQLDNFRRTARLAARELRRLAERSAEHDRQVAEKARPQVTLEELAQVIDPEAVAHMGQPDPNVPYWYNRWTRAFEQADAVLGLLSSSNTQPERISA